MSLIMDAIKRAQELRSNKREEMPYFKKEGGNFARRPGRKYFWIIAGTGLGLLFYLFTEGSNFLPPRMNPKNQILAAGGEKKPLDSTPVKTESPESPQEGLSSPSTKGGAQSKDIPAPFLGSKPSSPKEEQPSATEVYRLPPKPKKEKPKTKLSAQTLAQNEESSVQSAVEQKERMKGELTQKEAPAAAPASPSPVSQKIDTPSLKNIGLKTEEGKESNTAGEVLAHFNSGISFYQQGEITRAIQAYQKVIALDPAYVEAYNNLGIIYQEIGEMDRALEAFQKSVEINPRYEKGYNNLGILLCLKERNEKALETFQKGLALNPENIESHLNLGILFKKRGQTDNALESYQKALAINPFHGETHYNIGLLYEQLEKIELAINHYQKFIHLCAKTRPDLVWKVQKHINYLLATKGSKEK